MAVLFAPSAVPEAEVTLETTTVKLPETGEAGTRTTYVPFVRNCCIVFAGLKMRTCAETAGTPLIR